MIQSFIGELGKLNLEFNLKIYQILKNEGINTSSIKKINEKDLEMESLSKYPLNIIVRNCIEGPNKKRFCLSHDVLLNFSIVEYILEKSGNLVNSRLYEFDQNDNITLFEVKLIDSKIKWINFILNERFKSLGIRFSEYVGYFGKNKKGQHNYICDFSISNLRSINNNSLIDSDLYLKIIEKI